MALWGSKDLVANNNSTTNRITTIASQVITFAGARTGTAATPGDWLHFTTDGGTTWERGIIKTVDSDTVLTLHAKTSVTDGTGKTYNWYISQNPQYVADQSMTDIANVYGVDNAETGVANAAGKGIKHAGWVKKIDRGSGRVPQFRYETLVAMGSMTGDAGAAETAKQTLFPDS